MKRSEFLVRLALENKYAVVTDNNVHVGPISHSSGQDDSGVSTDLN